MRGDRGTVGALYDIHGNLPALDAALAAARAAGVTRFVIGGDVVLGPMPRECLARLAALEEPVEYLRGNCDRLVVEAFDGSALDALPAAVRGPIHWVASQLRREERDRLAAWPLTRSIEVDGLGRVLFCHASPRRDDESLTARTGEAEVREALAGVGEGVVVCGHTHMQFDRTIGTVRLLNAGSVGMPFDAPGAHWLALGPGVRLERTPYDPDAARSAIAATGYPAGFDIFRP